MFAGNAIRGEAPLHLGGSVYTLCYDWNALAVIAHKVGQDVNLFDPETLAVVLSLGLSKHHPGVTPDVILDASPPLGAAVQDYNLAMRYCYFGHGAPPDREDAGGQGSDAPPPDRMGQIVQAYGTAFRCGIGAADFWGLTPFQTNVLVTANSEKLKDDFETLLSAAWHTAVFSRIKEIPPLKSLMRNHRDPTIVNDDDDEDQIEAKKMIAALMGATQASRIITQAPPITP